MEKKTLIIRIGDFFFKYRNLLFPAVVISLLLIRAPEYSYFGSERAEEIKDWIAAAIVIIGLSLRAAVIGFAYIKRGGLKKQVYADTLVTEGFFRICRNPLYVGNLIIYLGVMLMHGSPWVIALGMAFFLFVYQSIVAAEEYFLRNKFGKEYTNYCREVPRWTMKFSKLPQAIKGMKFSFSRVVVKDYTTIANTVFGITAIELIEEYKFYPMLHHQIASTFLFGILAACIFIVVFVRFLKKRHILQA